MPVDCTVIRSDICLDFPAEADAQFVLQTLEVDAELQPEKIHRTMTVKGPALHVYVCQCFFDSVAVPC